MYSGMSPLDEKRIESNHLIATTDNYLHCELDEKRIESYLLRR